MPWAGFGQSLFMHSQAVDFQVYNPAQRFSQIFGRIFGGYFEEDYLWIRNKGSGRGPDRESKGGQAKPSFGSSLIPYG